LNAGIIPAYRIGVFQRRRDAKMDIWIAARRIEASARSTMAQRPEGVLQEDLGATAALVAALGSPFATHELGACPRG
jgi:hypothetical protein